MSDVLPLDAACSRAIERGCYVVLPADNELFVDIDSEADFTQFKELVEIMAARFENVLDWGASWSPSREPGRRHVIVRLSHFVTNFQRAAYQAALGSDRKRELLTLLRVKLEQPNPSMFFEKDDAEMVAAFAAAYELGGHEAALALEGVQRRVSTAAVHARGDLPSEAGSMQHSTLSACSCASVNCDALSFF